MRNCETTGWLGAAGRIPALLVALTVALVAVTCGYGEAGEDPADRLNVIRRVIGERQGEYDLFEGQLKTFINDYPSNPVTAEALFLLGFCQDKQKKNEAAAQSYSRVLTEFPAASETLRADAALGAGDAWFRAGRYVEAADAYSKVIGMASAGERVEGALLWRAEANHRLGLAAVDKGGDGTAQFKNALDDYSRFIEKYPDSKSLATALNGAGFSAFDLGDYAAAEGYFNRYVSAFPATDRADAHARDRAGECQYYAGESLYRLKRYTDARAAYKNVLDRYPGHALAPDARAGMAWCDLNLGGKLNAAEGFEEAAKLAEAAKDQDLQLSFLYDAGCAWQEEGDLNKAGTALTKVAEASGHEMNGLAWFRLASLWQAQAKTARERAEANPGNKAELESIRKDIGGKAILYFRKAIDSGKLGDEEVEAHALMGEVMLDAGRNEEAANTFAELVKRWPDSVRVPWALYHEALACREMERARDGDAGLEQRALASLRRAVEYPQAGVRLMATWALADQLSNMNHADEARGYYKWLADEGIAWAIAWRGPDGKADPSLEARAKEYAADSLFRLGESYYFASDLPRALTYYQQAIASYPGTPQAANSMLRLGEAAEAGKDMATAGRHYADAVNLSLRLGKGRAGTTLAFAQLRLGASYLAAAQGEKDPARRTKQFQEALRQLEAVQADPAKGISPARVRYYLAEVKYGLDRKADAKTDYEACIAAEPTGELADAAWFNLAWCLRDLGDKKGATEACGKVIDSFPNSRLRPDALVFRASMRREDGDPDAALADLDRFMAEYSGSPLAAKAELERATALDEDGRHAEAAAAFDKFIKAHPGHADLAQAMYLQSWALWNQIKPKVKELRDKEAAWRSISGGLSIMEIPPERRAEAEKALAEMNAAAERVKTDEDAILSLLRNLTANYPDYAVADAAWLRIGEILYDRKEYEQASNAYRKALELAERGGTGLADKAQYRLAWSIQRLSEASDEAVLRETEPAKRESLIRERWDRRLAAIEAFEAIPGKYPKSELAGEANYRAAEIRRRSGQDTSDSAKRSDWFGTAVTRYRQALKQEGGDVSYRRGAEYNLSLCLLLDGKAEEARKGFQKFLTDNDDGPYTQDAYWGLGQANLELGAYSEAETAFNRAIEIDKEAEAAAKSRYGLGLAAAQAGDMERSRLELLAVDSLYPNYPQWAARALVRAARDALAAGNKDKAIGDLERVLSRYPETTSAAEARDLQSEIAVSE